MSTGELLAEGMVRLSASEDTVPEICILVPVKERPEPLDALYCEYAAPLRAAGESFEFIFLAEPWAVGLTDALEPLIEQGEPIRILEAGQTLSEAVLMQAGAAHARGDIVVTLPAYRRIEAFALPALISIVREGTEVAVARRWPRRDSAINRLQNRIFHSLVAGVAGDRIHDVACGVRAMRRQLLLDLPVYGDFHRFLPLFAMREGYTVRELAVPQHPADVGTRVFGPGVYLRRLVDLLGLFFLLRFTEKPLRFFGLMGSVISCAGGLLLLVLLVQRLAGQGIADRPLLVLSVLLLVLGFQAIALGLVGEIIVHLSAPSHKPYRIAPRVGTGRVSATSSERRGEDSRSPG